MKVVFIAAAAFRPRNDVLDLKRTVHKMLRAEAIPATITRLGANPATKFIGNISVAHVNCLWSGWRTQAAAHGLAQALGLAQQTLLVDLHQTSQFGAFIQGDDAGLPAVKQAA